MSHYYLVRINLHYENAFRHTSLLNNEWRSMLAIRVNSRTKLKELEEILLNLEYENDYMTEYFTKYTIPNFIKNLNLEISQGKRFLNVGTLHAYLCITLETVHEDYLVTL